MLEALAQQGDGLLDSIADFCRRTGMAESTFGRLLGIHSRGGDPGLEIVRKVWPDEDPFQTNRHDVLRAVFRYDMHTLPTEVSASIGTSTLFAAWNAAVYVAQIDDERLGKVIGERKYLDATREVLQAQGGLWFLDESYVVSRKRS